MKTSERVRVWVQGLVASGATFTKDHFEALAAQVEKWESEAEAAVEQTFGIKKDTGETEGQDAPLGQQGGAGTSGS